MIEPTQEPIIPPLCPKCGLPMKLKKSVSMGAWQIYKAWICTNPMCNLTLP